MTGRSLPEWIGKTPDAKIPNRVKARLMMEAGGKCAVCGRKLGVGGEPPEFDHVIALINGGEHREANLRPVCGECHSDKSKEDMRLKKKIARIQKKNLGLHKPKNTIPGSRSSKFKRKVGGGVVRRDEE